MPPSYNVYLRKMVEAIITGVASLVIGVGGGIAAMNSKSNTRMDQLDKRIDAIELRFAEKYVPRQELANALQKMEDHMVRIEQKLDKLMFHEKV
jgi:prefoldin subunit 5